MTAIRAMMGALFGAALGLVALLASHAPNDPAVLVLLPVLWVLTLILVVPTLFFCMLPASAILERARSGAHDRNRFALLGCGLGVATALALLLGVQELVPQIDLLRGLAVALVGGAALGFGSAWVGLPPAIPVAEELPPSPREFFATVARRRDRLLLGKELP